MVESVNPSTIYPRVRDACESCHRRKIRCHLASGSPACQSCMASGDSCLFAPRAKAGRPRRTHSETHQRQKLSWQMRENQRSKGPNENERPHSSPAGHNIELVDDMQFGAIIALENYWDPEKMTSVEELGDIDFTTHYTTSEEAPTEKVLQSEAHLGSFERDGQLGLLTPSHSSNTPQCDTLVSTHESIDFDAILRLCGNLDQSYRSFREAQVDSKPIKSTLQVVENACNTFRMSASSALTERAANALILAAVYKTLDICESLVRHVIDGDLKADILERSFQLQRLDLALFQAYLLVSHTGQADASKKVSDLHTWIKATLQQEEYRVIW